MPSVEELAADDPYDVEAATRAAKKMTSVQLRDRLTAASADATGLKPVLVERWVATAREVALAKKAKRVTGEDVARVSDAKEGNEIWTRDPARLRGRDAVLYATLDKALRAYCGPNPGDDDFDDEIWCFTPRPPLRVELIKIRDFKSPRGGEAPEFWVGEIWDGQWTGRRRPAFVNRNEFAARLKRAEPTRTSLYTGNEGMESGYIYTSAVIMLGESCIGDY